MYERAIEALENAIFEATENINLLSKHFSYSVIEADIKDHEEHVAELREAIIALKMTASGNIRVK